MTEQMHLGSRAKVTRATGSDADKMLKLAKQQAPDPSVFDQYPALFWKVRASSNRLDFYHTRMSERTLQNFVRGLKAGVSYQDSHDSRRNGWGQSIDGQLIKTNQSDPAIGKPIIEAWGDFFTLSGLTLSGQSTDDFGAAIRAGVWRDVSVGFFASDIECGLCGKQLNDWGRDGCPHIPGVEYELSNGKTALAWAWINDGELSEVSQVYDGASPSAAVVKAEQMSLEGVLPERARVALEQKFDVRIATPQRRYALGAVTPRRAEPKREEESSPGITRAQIEAVIGVDELRRREQLRKATQRRFNELAARHRA